MPEITKYDKAFDDRFSKGASIRGRFPWMLVYVVVIGAVIVIWFFYGHYKGATARPASAVPVAPPALPLSMVSGIPATRPAVNVVGVIPGEEFMYYDATGNLALGRIGDLVIGLRVSDVQSGEIGLTDGKTRTKVGVTLPGQWRAPGAGRAQDTGNPLPAPSTKPDSNVAPWLKRWTSPPGR